MISPEAKLEIGQNIIDRIYNYSVQYKISYEEMLGYIITMLAGQVAGQMGQDHYNEMLDTFREFGQKYFSSQSKLGCYYDYH